MARARVPALAVIAAVAALVFVGGGVFIVVIQQTGARATATVTECTRAAGPRAGVHCTGTWIAGGSLLDGGHVVRGTIEGANRDHVGQTVEVRLSGDRAYTTSLRLPIVLVITGASIAVLGGIELRRRRRRDAGDQGLEPPAPARRP